ncbi:MAG: fibronectin type III domain-containing protein [Chthonomonas sp.]|nr:fibronectin type III domain-containing protein [Chthonomonas sp.]
MYSDVELKNELPNFLAQTTANATELGVTAEEIDLLTDNIALFDSTMDDVVATKAAAKAAVSAKNEAAYTLRRQISSFSQTWRANDAIPNETLDKVNVPPHATGGTHTPATAPSTLDFTMVSASTFNLKWSANGNKPATVYNIETSPNGLTDWVMVRSTTKTKAQLSGTPGDPLFIRIRAVRGDSTSLPSNIATIWPLGGSGTGLELAA